MRRVTWRSLHVWHRGQTSVLTLRLLTHLNEYLHFLDFHLPLPQFFLPGALTVFVGVSGRSALVPLSTLTASSCKHKKGVDRFQICRHDIVCSVELPLFIIDLLSMRSKYCWKNLITVSKSPKWQVKNSKSSHWRRRKHSFIIKMVSSDQLID